MTVPKDYVDDWDGDKGATPEGQSLTQLHALLKSSTTSAADGIRSRIRQMLPIASLGVLPHRKTPKACTRVLHMNYMRGQAASSAEMEHLLFFAHVVRELGLRLDILTDESCREEIEQALAATGQLDYTITTSQTPVSKWAEDSVEYLENGQVAVLRQFDDELLQWAMTAGRRQRWQGKLSPENLEAALRDDHLWILLGTRVNVLKTGVGRELAARDRSQQVGHIRAYIEGGNMIAGEDATGQPVLLVGKDAIAATARLYQLKDAEVRQVIAEDFGLDSIDRVICVEQPGKFHLDMGLLFVGDGRVIVNDSCLALKDAIEMVEWVPSLTTQAMAAKLQLQCSLEEDTVADLQAAGLTVQREKLENDVFYNFFNGEFVVGKDGCNYYITNGGPKEQEERLEALLIGDLGVVEKIFFSPQAIAQKSLQEQGGVGCRLKGSRT
ncbi:MAG: hypothetical protein AAF959_01795 [Cyanobacteria bacterium P01_D01_bin.56]